MRRVEQRNIFDRIREGCSAVAARAKHVHLREEEIPGYARRLASVDMTMPALDTEHHFVGSPDETLAYFVTLGAVNFGSGYFPHLSKRPSLSGYFTIASALTERFRSAGPMIAEDLAAIDAGQCTAVFGQDEANEPIQELMSLFAIAWNDLGRHLLDRFDGSFAALIEAAGGSAARLVALLGEQQFFRDESIYGNLVVPFYKRSQLLASDLALAFDGKGHGRFADLDRLTIFADNLVPHVLRVDGLLAYSHALAKAIDRGEPIPAGSEEEIEIRGCAIHAVERIREVLEGECVVVSSRQLDQILWHRGQQPAVKRAANRHRTRTVYY